MPYTTANASLTKNIKNEPFVGAHFFAFDVRSARISPRRPFAKRSAGPADWILRLVRHAKPQRHWKNGSTTWGEKRLGFLKRGSWTSDILATNKRIANEFNFLQHNRNMCSHYSVKSHVSVSLVPGKISLGVISMDGVKAFEKIAMDLQLLHNQIKHIGIWRLLVKDLIG